MLTATQIASIIMLLQAFGVPPATVDYIRIQISTPQTAQATTTQAVGIPANSSVPEIPATTIETQTETPLIVPVCELATNSSPYIRGGVLQGYRVSFSWRMNLKATGFLSGYGHLPMPTSYVQHPPSIAVIQTASSTVTYVLTESMTDPTYQKTTTCWTTVNTSSL